MSPALRTGMPLRDDRVHRYVNAFCPRCHEEDPDRPPAEVLASVDESVGRPVVFDPLRLCVFTTVALIAVLTGPIAVLGFALVAIAGYARARRAGLLRSRCKLGTPASSSPISRSSRSPPLSRSGWGR